MRTYAYCWHGPTAPHAHVRGLFNTSGSATHSYKYSPFGQAQSASEGTHNPLRFAARELDAGTGMYYVRARWYDPVLGRFLSEDPIGIEGGINTYAYALNDPVNLADPTGLAPWSCDFNEMSNSCGNGVILPGITVTATRGPNSGFSPFLFSSRGTSLMAGMVIGGWQNDGSLPGVPVPAEPDEPGSNFAECMQDNRFSSLFDGTRLDGTMEIVEGVSMGSVAGDLLAMRAKGGGSLGTQNRYASGLNWVTRRVAGAVGGTAGRHILRVGRAIGDRATPVLAVTGAFMWGYNGTIAVQCGLGIL